MKLVDNWQAVVKHAWSLWLIALATALDLGSEVIPYVSD
jgi:thiamine kinase-like enzyme